MQVILPESPIAGKSEGALTSGSKAEEGTNSGALTQSEKKKDNHELKPLAY